VIETGGARRITMPPHAAIRAQRGDEQQVLADLGLDASGTLVLDFGPRSFRVVFDESLKPAVLDETKKRLPDLPKPKQTDDAEKAKEATDTWKALKKDAKVLAAGQLLRLEVAMCAQRRWATPVFRRFLVDHPLLAHVVRRLLWGTYDGAGQLASTFRVEEDSSFADAQDGTIDLASDASVGIVHRLDLDDAAAGAWGQIFADYEVLQPFAQTPRAGRSRRGRCGRREEEGRAEEEGCCIEDDRGGRRSRWLIDRSEGSAKDDERELVAFSHLVVGTAQGSRITRTSETGSAPGRSPIAVPSPRTATGPMHRPENASRPPRGSTRSKSQLGGVLCITDEAEMRR